MRHFHFRHIHRSFLLRTLSLVFLIGLSGFAGSFSTVTAQSGAIKVLINYPEVREVDGGLQLNIYFTLVDDQGQAVDTEIQSANVMVDNEAPSQATVSTPQTPLYIVMALDASGSMEAAGADSAMRAAALEFVNTVADTQQAYFAVIRFNQTVTLLQDFTADRNLVRNAIGEVTAEYQSGTCLYDAAYAAVGQLASGDIPQARRAVLLFTDGKDDVYGGGICSSHTLDQVVSLAQSEVRVPIHTIGLRTTSLDESVLKNISSSTGGLLAFGEQGQLSGMFSQITTGLSRQWVASAVVHPTAGDHQATLSIKLSNGTFIHATTDFFSPDNYYVPPTPTPAPLVSPTPTPVTVTITAVTVDEEYQQMVVEATVTGETDANGNPVVSEYLVEVFDSKNIKRLELPPIPAPLADQVPIRLSIGDLPSDTYMLRLNALSARREYLSRSDYRVTYVAPVPPTPTSTVTPVPVGAIIDAISYDEQAGDFVVQVTLVGAEQIQQLRTILVNKSTGFLEGEYLKPAGPEVRVPVANLLPGEYTVTVYAIGMNGEAFSLSQKDVSYNPPPTATPYVTETPTPLVISITVTAIEKTETEFLISLSVANGENISRYRVEFIETKSHLRAKEIVSDIPADGVLHMPLEGLAGDYNVVVSALDQNGTVMAQSEHQVSYAPTPTPTPAVTLTATPRLPAITITSLKKDGDFFVIEIVPQNTDLISRLQVEFIDTNTNLVVKELSAAVPANNVIRVPLEDLPGGQYDVYIHSIDQQGNRIHSAKVSFKYDPPATPTPTPVATFTPTPPPPSTTNKIADVFQGEKGTGPQAVAIGGVGILLLGLVLVLVILLRPQREHVPDLVEVSGPVELPKPDLGYQSGQTNVDHGGYGWGSSTTPDPDGTAPVVQSLMPDASLEVQSSRDKSMIGRQVEIGQSLFLLGRKGSNLDFDRDNNVSRRHAEIVFEGRLFFIRDVGSTLGTDVDGMPLSRGDLVPLRSESVIRLGETTVLIFHSGDELDRTGAVITPDIE